MHKKSEEVYGWITLALETDLNEVGITAKFSSILAEQNIPCNVVAGYHHDHLFVPIEKIDQAIVLLNEQY